MVPEIEPEFGHIQNKCLTLFYLPAHTSYLRKPRNTETRTMQS